MYTLNIHKVFDLFLDILKCFLISVSSLLEALIHSTLSLIFIVFVRFDASFTNARVLILHAVRAVL